MIIISRTPKENYYMNSNEYKTKISKNIGEEIIVTQD